MKPSSIDPPFAPAHKQETAIRPDKYFSLHHIRHHIGVSEACITDAITDAAGDMAGHGQAEEALGILQYAESILTRFNRDTTFDALTAIRISMAALLYSRQDYANALKTAADALSILSTNPKRKDSVYLSLLGATLYNLSLIHSGLNRYRQAEREITKALKIYGRLAKINPERYAAAVMTALDASTSIYRSRIEQVNLLAHYQAATSMYIELYRSGTTDAASRLIESLENEGHTLADMGRHREAVQYFTRALKYLTRIEPEFTIRHLSLSVDLGQSLIEYSATRDKGIHLLNTMLHKSTRLGANDIHLRIVNILYEAKSPSLSILTLWYKIFPK